jgi:AraC-like DNA-binding protein
MEKDTVAMYFVAAAVAQLSGDARECVLTKAAIPPDLLSAPHARVTAESFAALWMAVAHELDDEFFGLDTRRMKVGSFALLCHAVLHCANLDKALKGILRGFGVLLDDIRADLRLENGQAVVSVADRIASPSDRRFAEETLLIMIHGLMCWLAGKRIPLTRAEFAYPRPIQAPEYAVMYSENLHFDVACTRICFDARFLGASVVQNAGTLRQFLRTAPQSVFLKYKNEDSWTTKLRRRLRGSIGEPTWPLLQDVASEFHVTPTTLRRRLIAEGTSFQDIKDQLRRDAAIDHLCNSALNVAQIATLVGFQDPSAFHRAFKQWSGVQPREYRLRQTQPAPSEGSAECPNS